MGKTRSIVGWLLHAVTTVSNEVRIGQAIMHGVAISSQCWRVHLLRKTKAYPAGESIQRIWKTVAQVCVTPRQLCNSCWLTSGAGLRCAAHPCSAGKTHAAVPNKIRSSRYDRFYDNKLVDIGCAYVICSMRLNQKHDMFGLSFKNPWCLSLFSALLHVMCAFTRHAGGGRVTAQQWHSNQGWVSGEWHLIRFVELHNGKRKWACCVYSHVNVVVVVVVVVVMLGHMLVILL